jgi:hypothetical protein
MSDFVICSANFKNGNEMYLTNLTPVEFTDSLDKSTIFMDEESARGILYRRFLSLSNWISTHSGDLLGIDIEVVKNDKVVRRDKFL